MGIRTALLDFMKTAFDIQQLENERFCRTKKTLLHNHTYSATQHAHPAKYLSCENRPTKAPKMIFTEWFYLYVSLVCTERVGWFGRVVFRGLLENI